MKSIVTLIMLALTGSVMAQTFDMKVSSTTSSAVDEGEAKIAINPTDSNKMVIGFMQSSTTSLVFKVYRSSDAGSSWQVSPFNPASYITPDFPGYVVAGGGDILLAYDKTGKLYCTWIYVLANPNMPNYQDSMLWVSYWAHSLDDGQTFTLQPDSNRFWGIGKFDYGPPLVVYNYNTGICDRDWLAVDLTDGPYANNLYVGFINYTNSAYSTGLKVRTKKPGDNFFSAPALAAWGNGQLSNLMVDRKGILHYTYANVATQKIFHTSSTDGGLTFPFPHLIANATGTFPQSGKYINNRENAAPSLAIDSADNLYVVWNDFPGNTFPFAYFSKSSDAGITWSAPLDLDSLFNGHVFMPTITAKNNRVTISANVLDNSKKSNYCIVTSFDNGTNFSVPIKVSSGITDFAAMGKTVFVGDYSSSERTKCYIFSAWTDARANGRKQYISKYNDCVPIGIQELTPVNSTLSVSNIFPVPAINSLNISVNSEIADDLAIDIVDIEGKILLSKKQPVTKGTNSFSMELGALAAGNYILRLTNKEQDFITRMIVKN